MAVRHWHWGKLVLLWSWGGVCTALLLTDFLSGPVEQSPWASLLTFVASLLILAVLSAVTWRWLGGKEVATPEERMTGAPDHKASDRKD